MFTETLTRRVLTSPLVNLLTGPHGVDRYTELVDPAWTWGETRGKVTAVRRQTAGSVTLTIVPNAAFAPQWSAFRAGQHLNLSIEVDGRRRTRCYSPANAEGDGHIELTVGRQDRGVVSNHLYEHARPGLVVGLDRVDGEFTLDDPPAERILLISGGSGITPVLSMARTLSRRRRRGEFHGEVAVLHYARTAADACYAGELSALPGVRVLFGFTRDGRGADLDGRFGPDHVAAAMPDADAVYVCGPPALVDSVREDHPQARFESFVPPSVTAATQPAAGGRVVFADSGVERVDDGRALLYQAEAAGLTPESGCRMGICHSCTRRKTSGVVRNMITGAMSSPGEEDVQICVSAPAGDVRIAL